MASKKDSVEKTIEQAMPGWKVMKRRPAADGLESVAAHVQPDAVSPGLEAQQAKAGAVKKGAAKKTTKKTVGRAQFVTVTPAGQPDSIRKFQKVVLVKSGKVIAQQG